MDITSLGAFAISLAIAIIVAFPLGRQLRIHSGVFYAIAAAVVVAYVWLVASGVNLNAYRMFTFVIQKGYLASVLLAFVMFVGCFDGSNAFKKRLRPIRGELSILSFIFILGHMAVFLPSYAGRLFGGSVLKPNAVASIWVALILGFIFLVLGVTSFKFIRKRMDKRVWKIIQRFAYLVVALYIVHIGFFLFTSAFGGSGKGLASFVVYAAVVAAYAVLRVSKAVRDARRGGDPDAGVGDGEALGQ